MNKSNYTHHALTRMQQRAIDHVLVDLVLTVGKGYSDGRGGTVYSLSDKRLRARVARELRKKAEKLEKENGLYVVESNDGCFITVGHQFKKLRNDLKVRS